MMDKHGEKYVYALAAGVVGLFTLMTVLFSKEPPLRSETPPQFNPIPVIKHIVKLGFSNKRIVWLFIANGLVCGIQLVAVYVPLQAMVNLHMTKAQIGQDVLQYGTIAQTALAFFIGWGIDKLGSAKAILLGFLLATTGMLLGFSPASHITQSALGALVGVLSLVSHHTFRSSPTLALAAAYLFVQVALILIYWAQHVYTASCVRREDLATFGTCNGAVNVLILTLGTQLSGVLIKRVFGGNYGFAFIVATVITAIGVPIFFWIDRVIRRERLTEIELDLSAAVAVMPEALVREEVADSGAG